MRTDIKSSSTGALEAMQRYINLTRRPPKEIEERYQLTAHDICTLYDLAKESLYDALVLSFEFGMTRAYRAIERTYAKGREEKAVCAMGAEGACYPSVYEVKQATETFTRYMGANYGFTRIDKLHPAYMSTHTCVENALAEVWKQGRLHERMQREKLPLSRRALNGNKTV